MPNHIHLIIEIYTLGNKGKPENTTKSNHFWEQKTILGKTVQALKASVTRRVGHPIWHRSYYDEIIRDEDQFINTYNYITLNPTRWEETKNTNKGT